MLRPVRRWNPGSGYAAGVGGVAGVGRVGGDSWNGGHERDLRREREWFGLPVPQVHLRDGEPASNGTGSPFRNWSVTGCIGGERNETAIGRYIGLALAHVAKRGVRSQERGAGDEACSGLRSDHLGDIDNRHGEQLVLRARSMSKRDDRSHL